MKKHPVITWKELLRPYRKEMRELKERRDVLDRKQRRIAFDEWCPDENKRVLAELHEVNTRYFTLFEYEKKATKARAAMEDPLLWKLREGTP